MKYTNVTNAELIALEESLDYRDPEIIGEILRRAEFYCEGITEQYEAACPEGDPLLSEIFDKAFTALQEEE